ncbi:alpha/beta-hydrolase [Butyriboletus roseoflavus]|nr:alpha/beta-hydrolase [Butyriboletus roseoflavus]
MVSSLTKNEESTSHAATKVAKKQRESSRLGHDTWEEFSESDRQSVNIVGAPPCDLAMSDSDIVHLQASSSVTSSPRTKPTPKSSKIPLVFSYTPSDDGTDENLLILLHGLAIRPLQNSVNRSIFHKQSILALRAPEQIPYLYEQAFQWYTSFNPLGEIVERPNPTPALEVMAKVLDYLITECTWPPNRIHLFGFGQGGSVAAEITLAWWKKEFARTKTTSNSKQTSVPSPRHLASVASISGPLLSYPTLATPCPTPLLIFSRVSIAKDVSTAFSKGFTHTRQVVKPGSRGEESMPRSRDEWEPAMQFWSEVLGRRMGDGLYEVMTGTAA